MKKIYGLLGALALFSLASCSNDEPATAPNDQQEADFYMTMTITQSYGSRTSTPDQGEEYGQDYENTITNGLFVLTEKGEPYNIVASAEIAYENISGSSPAYKASFKMVRDELAQKIGDKDEMEFNTFVIANAPTTLCDEIAARKGQPIQGVFALTEESNIYWQNNKFLMTNKKAGETKITKADVEPGAHATKQTALPLGTVDVQRAMSRFDIATGEDNTVFTVEDEKSPLYGVKFTVDAISLINQATVANLFKEVGNTPEDKKMFADETYQNYVFSPEQTAYLFPFYETSGNAAVQDGRLTGSSKKFTDLKYTLLTSLKTPDNANYTHGDKDTPHDDYFIWTYCMPNSNYDKDNQVHGNTTGVVYRVMIEFANEKYKDATEPIYTYGNIILGSYSDLKDYVKSKEDDPDRIALQYEEAKKSFGSADDQATIDAALVSKGFNIYRPTDGKYYCYYIYWNRHNDNNNNSLMWYTEFATVRNNVYKLALTGINQLGHPGDPKDDNEPEDPNTPDEEDNFWGEIQVNVLPWEVRINNFEF